MRNRGTYNHMSDPVTKETPVEPEMPARREVRQISFFRVFLYLCLCGFITLLCVGYTMLSGDEYTDGDTKMPGFKEVHESDHEALQEVISEPLILWWTSFTGVAGAYRKCGSHSCFFTNDRHYLNHQRTQVLMFYGSNIEMKDMPVPRKPHHQWALLHEESPKNNYLLTQPHFIELFNHTGTFKRESDFPLTLQYVETLEWLESTTFMVPTERKNELQGELKPLIYVQSDCDVPSGRDDYVQALMRWVGVDSYGTCLHNKDLPSHLRDPIDGMEHNDFYHLQAKYKFSFAMENALCDDYITEKIWRPLMLGSVPIILGSPKIRDFLPDNYSAILVEDFKSAKDLADYLTYLNKNDDEYNKYLAWKKTGVTNTNLKDFLAKRTWAVKETWKGGQSNFVEDFECFVCDRLHQNIQRQKQGQTALHFTADKSHLSCPGPISFDADGKKLDSHRSWSYSHRHSFFEAEAVKYFVDQNLPLNAAELHAKISEIKYKNGESGWF